MNGKDVIIFVIGWSFCFWLVRAICVWSWSPVGAMVVYSAGWMLYLCIKRIKASERPRAKRDLWYFYGALVPVTIVCTTIAGALGGFVAFLIMRFL